MARSSESAAHPRREAIGRRGFLKAVGAGAGAARSWSNVWLAGGGSAEAFKFGPVLGDYIAHRVLGDDRERELADGFRLKDEEFGA